MRYKFQIPIGDWSGDGHSNVEWYICSSNKPLTDVREAYFSAIEKLDDDFNPETFVNGYEEHIIDIEFYEKILETFPILHDIKLYKVNDFVCLNSDFMAAYVVEFIKAGDPEIRVSMLPNDQIPMLPFYGYDEKKRHIGHIGYGITSY